MNGISKIVVILLGLVIALGAGLVVSGPVVADDDGPAPDKPIAVRTVAVAADASIPQKPADVLANYCVDCHDAGLKKGGVNLDVASIDWSSKHDRALWQRVLQATEQGLMPPAKKDQPTAEERAALSAWLDVKLLKHTPIGGTPPRRLNQAEYQATVRQLFDLPQFTLPVGFPSDTQMHGFDNVGQGLVLSPPLLEAYSKVAWQVADELYPPAKPEPRSTTRKAGPDDMVISFSASSVRRGALRLASRSTSTMRSCTWPSRMEITDSGVYRVTVSASMFKPKTKAPMVLEVRARDIVASDRTDVKKFRLIKEISVDSQNRKTISFEAELYEGQAVLMRWKNAEMDHESVALAAQMKAWFEKDKRFLAAWQAAVFPDGLGKGPRATRLRGANGWRIIKEHLADPKLDMSQATMDSNTTKRLLATFDSNEGTFNLADALCHYYFENGPALQLHGLMVKGPLKQVAGPKDKRRAELRRRLAGVERAGLSDEDYARQMLARFLPQAFRRPVDQQMIASYLSIAQEHWQAGHGFDEGMHLLIRSVLISPRFLYRSLRPGKLDDHDLATRLSYFLTQGPPDATLVELANAGRLSQPSQLRKQALRLMPRRPGDAFVTSFTGQWLGLRLLPEIMPDPKFNFTPYYVDTARAEVEHSFAEMIRANRPMTDFIDPDFTYTSPLFAQNVYKMERQAFDKESAAQKRKLRRITIPRGGRVGGLLGQSAIMMATANGVDTQPVLRGVWVLDNILGSPTPGPPEDVPALTPDTRGTTTPRQMLAAHTNETACIQCHKHIDPVGLMLENYDPVGRWRDRWPKGDARIDASGVLSDGTEIRDVVDFKRWLTSNVDVFSRCLAQKLMVYATGREPNHAEQNELKAIVKNNVGADEGFRELILDLVSSETFRTK